MSPELSCRRCFCRRRRRRRRRQRRWRRRCLWLLLRDGRRFLHVLMALCFLCNKSVSVNFLMLVSVFISC